MRIQYAGAGEAQVSGAPALKSPSFLEGAGIEIGQECHPSSALLLPWSSGEDKDHTFPALRVCSVKHGGPQGLVHPAREERTALFTVPTSPGDEAGVSLCDAVPLG